MPTVPTNNVVPLPRPRPQVAPEYAMMAAAELHEQGKLFEPIANKQDWTINLRVLGKLAKENPNDPEFAAMRDKLKSAINDPTPIPQPKPESGSPVSEEQTQRLDW